MKFSKSLLNPLGVFWVLFLMIASLIIWAFYFEIDKSITLTGNVRPVQDSSGIQTINGGRIKSYQLETGMRINKGDLVATFDYTEQTQKLAELSKQINSLRVVSDRLVAGLDKKKNFDYRREYDRQFYDIQKKIFTAELEASRREKRGIIVQIENLKAQVQMLTKQLTASEAEIELNAKKKHLVSQLFEKEFEGEIAFLEAQQEYDQSKLRNGELKSQRLQLAGEIETLQEKIVQVDNNFDRKIAAELFQISMQIEEIDSERNVLKAQIRKQNLISSENGRVTKVNVDNVGQVVEPGFTLAEFVSLDTDMAFEVMISPQYIKDISPGQFGKVVLSNMNTREGDSLYGRVFEIDGDVTVLENGDRFYRGVVFLDVQDSTILIPGVDGSVAVNLGKRTVANYFLEPILSAVSKALTEK